MRLSFLHIGMVLGLMALALQGCKKVEKRIAGFWKVDEVLANGNPSIVISEQGETGNPACPTITYTLTINILNMSLVFRDDKHYLISTEAEIKYETSSQCDNETYIDTMTFVEMGTWAQTDKTTVTMVPNTSDEEWPIIISFDGTPYTCDINEAKRKTLKMTCKPQNWKLDLLEDGDIDYVLETFEITASAID